MARTGITGAQVIAEMVRFPVESRADLCRRLHRSKASVSRLVDQLLTDGLLWEGSKQDEPRRGRKTTKLHVRPDIGYVIGADLEGSAVRACVLDASRRLVAGGHRAVGSSWTMPRTMKAWMGLIGDVVERSGVDREKLVGIGVGGPGVVLSDALRFHAYLRPGGRTDFDMEPALKTFGLPVTAANNVLCISEYEGRLGLGRNAPSFLSAVIRYGIGAAVCANGVTVTGDDVFTGELGHTTVREGGPACICGQRGCLDVYCSGRTLPEPGTRTGQPWSMELRKRARYLGIGLSNLLMIVHAPLVIVNGIYNVYEEDVRPVLAHELDARLSGLGLPPVETAFGEPGEFKASIGAALRAADAFLVEYLTKGV